MFELSVVDFQRTAGKEEARCPVYSDEETNDIDTLISVIRP